MENYETLGTIGEGTYGVVLKARHKETGQIVAIKKFKESDEDEQVRKTALREVRILKQLKHDNIVNLIEVFRKKSKLHLVFEYVERTILEDLERNPDGMDPIETKKCLWQLLRSIDYCHAHNIIHRDIKPENLLISRNGILKLCDFGFARTLAGPGARYTDYVATRWYRGPELLTGDTQYGKPVDIWAIGCMLPEMASGAPLFPGESDIDQLFHIMRCFGQLPPKLMDVFRANPLFIGIKIPENIQQTETLEERFPTYPEDQLSIMKNCLRYEPDGRCTCEELMNHRYFTDDGFVEWFDEELKQMLERDAADFKMRQKKFRKAKSNRGGGGNALDNGDSRPQSQPPASSGENNPPGLTGVTKGNKGSLPAGHSNVGQVGNQPMPPSISSSNAESRNISLAQPEPAAFHPTGESVDDVAGMGHLAHAPMLGGHNDGLGGPSAHEVVIERRPATRGSECGAGSSGTADYGSDEMPLLPNLQRPSTPRAQRLVAFPQLASAMDDSAGNGHQVMPTMGTTMGGQARNWGGSHGGLGGSHGMGSGSMSMSGGGMLPVGGKGKGRVSGEDVPSMPHLGAAMAPATNRESGGSNLPQLREGQVFAAELPERGYGGASLAHAPVPASRGGGGSKKKASAYDPSNPYFAKPSGKSKKVSTKGSSSSSHGLASQQMGGGGGGSSSGTSSQMGVIGQAHSIAGLAAAYALPPSALPPSIPPRTPNHDYDFGPPRTPGDGSGSQLQGLDGHNQFISGGGGGVSGGGGFPSSSQQQPGHKLSSSSYNYTGGQYAKYGKRY